MKWSIIFVTLYCSFAVAILPPNIEEFIESEPTVDEFIDIIQNQIQDDDEMRTLHDYADATSDRQDTENVYDYIIVGAGSAGTALTYKLATTRPGARILLLESGGLPFFLSEIPLFAAMLQFTPNNWGYLMEKQDNFCLGLTDERMPWPRGKGLGGSSIINMMIHIRGNRLDYDRWANLGNPGWSYDDLLPIFKEIEKTSVRISDAPYRGTSGRLGATDIPYRTKGVDLFVRSAMNLGYPYVDYNGANQMGVSYVQGTLRGGWRCSGEKAFIRPVRRYPNLKIRLHSHVTKVLIDESKTAYGVEYSRFGRRFQARARKQVILCAGAFHTPQILMLSGIGPEDHLTELQIPIIKNLPVGKKMYDHLTYLGLIFTSDYAIDINFIVAVLTLPFWLLLGIGPLTLLSGVEALLYFKTSAATHTENYPDMELMFIGGHIHTDYDIAFRKMFRVSDIQYNTLWRPLYSTHAVGVLPMLLHPKSYGNLTLRSANPFDAPVLHGNYFTDPNGQDMKAFIAAINESIRIMTSPPFPSYRVKQLTVPVPGCERFTFNSDPYLECALRHLSVTLHHQVSTCKMGPSDDPEAVVDNKLRVRGINNLTVADLSVVPHTVSAHTNVLAYTIGTKASYIIP